MSEAIRRFCEESVGRKPIVVSSEDGREARVAVIRGGTISAYWLMINGYQIGVSDTGEVHESERILKALEGIALSARPEGDIEAVRRGVVALMRAVRGIPEEVDPITLNRRRVEEALQTLQDIVTVDSHEDLYRLFSIYDHANDYVRKLRDLSIGSGDAETVHDADRIDQLIRSKMGQLLREAVHLFVLQNNPPPISYDHVLFEKMYLNAQRMLTVAKDLGVTVEYNGGLDRLVEGFFVHYRLSKALYCADRFDTVFRAHSYDDIGRSAVGLFNLLVKAVACLSLNVNPAVSYGVKLDVERHKVLILRLIKQLNDLEIRVRDNQFMIADIHKMEIFLKGLIDMISRNK